MKNRYLRALLADELSGIRKFCHKHRKDADTYHWMRFVAYCCHERTDQHIRHFGIGILTGESEGAFPNRNM